MLYYLGKGTEFKKEDCKEYKTIEGAMKAAAKDESFVVWDENGNVIGSLTDNVPEGALQTNPDGSVNTYDADGNKVGTVDAETVEKMTTFESDEDAAGQQEDAEDGGTVSNDAETTILRLNRKRARMGQIQSHRRQRTSRRTKSSSSREK